MSFINMYISVGTTQILPILRESDAYFANPQIQDTQISPVKIKTTSPPVMFSERLLML